jgi:hypothetical protein
MAEKAWERRQFFRIDDEVYLEYRLLDEESYRQRLQMPVSRQEGEADLALQLQSLSSQSSSLLAMIRKREPEIGQYLSIVDRKLELLAQAVLGRQANLLHVPNHRVDISGNGLAFFADKALETGSRLELHLMLFPSHTMINALGKVVYCTAVPSGKPKPYRIGVEFTLLAEIARDALIRHTLELQSARLRRERDL